VSRSQTWTTASAVADDSVPVNRYFEEAATASTDDVCSKECIRSHRTGDAPAPAPAEDEGTSREDDEEFNPNGDGEIDLDDGSIERRSGEEGQWERKKEGRKQQQQEQEEQEEQEQEGRKDMETDLTWLNKEGENREEKREKRKEKRKIQLLLRTHEQEKTAQQHKSNSHGHPFSCHQLHQLRKMALFWCWWR